MNNPNQLLKHSTANEVYTKKELVYELIVHSGNSLEDMINFVEECINSGVVIEVSQLPN